MALALYIIINNVESTLVRWLSLRYPRNELACREGFQLCLGSAYPKKAQINPTQLLAYIPRPNSVKRVQSGPLPPEQPRVVIHLSTLASTTRQRYPRTRRPIKMASKKDTNDWVTPTSSAPRKKKVKFSKPISTPETSHGPHRTLALGSRKFQQQQPIHLLYSARRLVHPPALHRR